MVDTDLAALYGVQTRRLNEQVRRNTERFPEDFVFQFTPAEFANLKSQFATSSWGGRRKLPLAFTEHGAIMAAMVLNSESIRPRPLKGLPARRNPVLEPAPDRGLCILCQFRAATHPRREAIGGNLVVN